MAFSRTERWSKRLDEIERDIVKWQRWTRKDVIPIADAIPRLQYAVSKVVIEESDVCQC